MLKGIFWEDVKERIAAAQAGDDGLHNKLREESDLKDVVQRLLVILTQRR